MKTLNKYLNGLCLWGDCTMHSMDTVCESHKHWISELYEHLEGTHNQGMEMIKKLGAHYYSKYNIKLVGDEDPDIILPIGNRTWSYRDYLEGRCEITDVTYFIYYHDDLELEIFLNEPLLIAHFPNKIIYDSPSEQIEILTHEGYENIHMEVMGIKEEIDQDELKKFYHKKALEVHPDKGGNAEEFQKLKDSYEILKKDPEEWIRPKIVKKKIDYHLGMDLINIIGRNEEWSPLAYNIMPLGKIFLDWSIASNVLFPLHREIECIKNIIVP